MKRKAQPIRHSIKHNFEGNEYVGSYIVEKDCVTVTWKSRSKGDVFGNLGAKAMAKHLFDEVLEGAKRERESRIRQIEKQLAMAERELDGWKRNGSQTHIAAGTAMVQGLGEALKRLRLERP